MLEIEILKLTLIFRLINHIFVVNVPRKRCILLRFYFRIGYMHGKSIIKYVILKAFGKAIQKGFFKEAELSNVSCLSSLST